MTPLITFLKWNCHHWDMNNEQDFFFLGIARDYFIWSNCDAYVISKTICIQQMSLNKISPWLDSHLTKSVAVNLHVVYKQYHMHVFPINRQHMVNIRSKVTYKNNCGQERSWNLGKFDKAYCLVEGGQQWDHLRKCTLTVVSNSFISELVMTFLKVRFKQYNLQYLFRSNYSRTATILGLSLKH